MNSLSVSENIKEEKAFTLIELFVTMAVIAIFGVAVVAATQKKASVGHGKLGINCDGVREMG